MSKRKIHRSDKMLKCGGGRGRFQTRDSYRGNRKREARQLMRDQIKARRRELARAMKRFKPGSKKWRELRRLAS